LEPIKPPAIPRNTWGGEWIEIPEPLLTLLTKSPLVMLGPILYLVIPPCSSLVLPSKLTTMCYRVFDILDGFTKNGLTTVTLGRIPKLIGLPNP
jgi:hypothetical protein